MPDPRIPYTLHIKSANIASGQVTIENLSASDKNTNMITADMDANGRATIELANMTNEVSNGDKIQIRASGARIGTATHTIDLTKRSATITLTESAAGYAGASINL